MTVASTTTPRTQYNGNSATTAFNTVFTFHAAADLIVVLTDTSGTDTTKTITTHYTVTGGAGSTGTVTMLTAPATGEKLTIYRATSRTQATDYIENDTFPAETHEAALDKLTRMIQEIDYNLSRATLNSVTGGVIGITLPTPSALSYLRWNSGATNLENAILGDVGTYSFPAGTGLLVQSATSTAIARTLTGTTNQITITDGDGLSGNPTIAFASTVDLTGSTVSLRDDRLTIVDNSDTTKKVAFEVSGVTTGTTRTLTMPNASGTIALTSELAPVDAQYITLATNTTLTSERVLTADTGISISDGGPGGNVTISPGAGAVLQVVSTLDTTAFSTTSTSFTDITGLSVSITPSSSSNKVLVRAVFNYQNSTNTMNVAYNLRRGTTDIRQGVSAGSRSVTSHWNNGTSNGSTGATGVIVLEYLDSPSTTSSTTYSVQLKLSTGTIVVNRDFTDTDNSAYYRYASTITAYEIKG